MSEWVRGCEDYWSGKRMNPNTHPLIKELRMERFAQNITQRELAKRIGIQSKTLNRWENGKGETDFPSMKILVRWTSLLGYELAIKKVS